MPTGGGRLDSNVHAERVVGERNGEIAIVRAPLRLVDVTPLKNEAAKPIGKCDIAILRQAVGHAEAQFLWRHNQGVVRPCIDFGLSADARKAGQRFCRLFHCPGDETSHAGHTYPLERGGTCIDFRLGGLHAKIYNLMADPSIAYRRSGRPPAHPCITACRYEGNRTLAWIMPDPGGAIVVSILCNRRLKKRRQKCKLTAMNIKASPCQWVAVWDCVGNAVTGQG
ncbi:hypothetical protein D3C76_1117040 [compost metagenome]